MAAWSFWKIAYLRRGIHRIFSRPGLSALFTGAGFEILNLGLPSETVSGLSEPNHAGGAFPRPDLHERTRPGAGEDQTQRRHRVLWHE